MFLRLARFIASPARLSRLLVFVLVGLMAAATAPRFGHDVSTLGNAAYTAMPQGDSIDAAPSVPLQGDEVDDDRCALEDDHAEPSLIAVAYALDLHLIAGIRPLSSDAILADAPIGTELRPPIG